MCLTHIYINQQKLLAKGIDEMEINKLELTKEQEDVLKEVFNPIITKIVAHAKEDQKEDSKKDSNEDQKEEEKHNETILKIVGFLDKENVAYKDGMAAMADILGTQAKDMEHVELLCKIIEASYNAEKCTCGGCCGE